MRKSFFTILSLSLAATPAFANTFKDSVRRNPNGNESRSVARMWVSGAEDLKATGFFVANSKEEVLMLTAQHVIAARGNIRAACKAGHIQIEQSGLGRGRCVDIIAEQGDFVLLKAEFSDKNAYRRVVPLSVSSREPRVGERLKTIGFPKNRGRALTVTENCEILPNSRIFQPSDFTDQDFARWKEARGKMKKEARQEKKTRSASFRANRFQTHVMNCSGYNGNSGGPVLLEGTDTVVGMPGGYYLLVSDTYPSDLGLPLAAFGGFRKALKSAGVVIK